MEIGFYEQRFLDFIEMEKNTHTKLNQKQNVFLLSKTVETVKTTKNSNEKKSIEKTN